MKLKTDFYIRPDVVTIARELLGKVLYTKINDKISAGIIVETEAYEGIIDKASHAYGGRHTDRTKIMYENGGLSYIYLCYGIHHLFNVVTNQKGVPHAVLVRAVEPIEGIPEMLKRRDKAKLDHSLTSGPGSLSQALNIHYQMSGEPLTGKKIWIAEEGIKVNEKDIIASPRVGVAYAKEHALWPYRFRIKDNPWVSKAK